MVWLQKCLYKHWGNGFATEAARSCQDLAKLKGMADSVMFFIALKTAIDRDRSARGNDV
ncbi:MAG: hypothetical protein HC769_05785 [Cyanobacteria bacterium CRU_2_1]|nr:hypothetical protein [Cyanobacteria bacterium CRU_2_1]